MTRNLKRLTTGVAGAAIACAVLAGCSSSPSPKASPPTTAPKGTTSTTAVPPYHAALNARQDVSTSSCTSSNGSWTLKGSIDNSAKKTRNYVIVVDFVTQPGDTVMDTKTIHVDDVASKANKAWSVTGAQGQKNMGCIVRFVQAQ